MMTKVVVRVVFDIFQRFLVHKACAVGVFSDVCEFLLANMEMKLTPELYLDLYELIHYYLVRYGEVFILNFTVYCISYIFFIFRIFYVLMFSSKKENSRQFPWKESWTILMSVFQFHSAVLCSACDRDLFEVLLFYIHFDQVRLFGFYFIFFIIFTKNFFFYFV